MDNYKELRLKDVAKYERAKEGQIYPKSCSLIQVSATNGQVEYLEESREVEGKYVVVTPNKDINPRYLNIVIKRNIKHFLSKYQAGMNIQMDDIKRIPIQLHDRKTQDMIAKHIEIMEQEEKNVNNKIESFKLTKSRFLKDLFA